MLVLLRRLHRSHLVAPHPKGRRLVASHRQWRTAIDAGDLRRITWVCGDQHVLIDEVITTTKDKLNPSDLDYVSFTYRPGLDRTIWAEAHQHPLNPGANRLIVIRNADTITNWAPLTGWLANTRNQPGVYLLFVSNEPDLPYLTKKTLKPHAALMRAPRGFLVRATLPTEPEAITWLQRRARLDTDTARYLLDRTGGDLTAAAHVCAKLNLFPAPAGKASIAALTPETPATGLCDSLIALDKRSAFLAAADVSTTERFKLIALLDSRLDLLHTLHRMQLAGRNWRDYSLNQFLTRQYLPYARHYDPASCVRRRRVLAFTEDAVRRGANTGVLEALIALW
jgi:DNA polymerase III delta subunit